MEINPPEAPIFLACSPRDQLSYRLVCARIARLERTVNATMKRVFISYRRTDTTPGYASLIYQNLADRFGDEQIFMDVDSLPLGVDFVKYLKQTLDATDAALVLIGPFWLNAADDAGGRRLDDPKDFVRIEVAAALRGGLHVIPVLVDGAQMPSKDVLPPNLKQLASLQALKFERRGREAIRDLIAAIEHGPVPPGRPISLVQGKSDTPPTAKAGDPRVQDVAAVTRTTSQALQGTRKANQGERIRSEATADLHKFADELVQIGLSLPYKAYVWNKEDPAVAAARYERTAEDTRSRQLDLLAAELRVGEKVVNIAADGPVQLASSCILVATDQRILYTRPVFTPPGTPKDSQLQQFSYEQLESVTLDVRTSQTGVIRKKTQHIGTRIRFTLRNGDTVGTRDIVPEARAGAIVEYVRGRIGQRPSLVDPQASP
jgi:hypothetical protein